MIKPFHIHLTKSQIASVSSDIRDIIASGSFVLGKHTEQLQDCVAKTANKNYGVTVSSGTVALECLFEFLRDYRQVKRVGVQSNTNFATVSAVVRAGLEVVFVDCDRNGQIDTKDIFSDSCDIKVDALAVVHIGGYISESIEQIKSSCESRNIILIEDCAHAHMSCYKSCYAGSYGYAAIFSYFPTKVVNGGEGGALVTDDKELMDYASRWRNQGKGGVYGNDHSLLGGSYRMPEINCRIALEYYSSLESEITKRAVLIRQIIDGVSGVSFYDPKYLDSFSAYKLIARIDGLSGEYVEQSLKRKDIFCGGAVYRTPCHKQPVFSNLRTHFNLAHTDQFCFEHFCLPLHSGISSENIERIIDSLSDFHA